MAGLEISTDKIGFVITKAREMAAKVAAWDDGATSDHDAKSILEDFSDDATQAELKEFIRDLNEDEQASLVALAWVGRGSFAPEEFDEAIATARAERTNRTDGLFARHAAPSRLFRGRARPPRLFGRGHRGRRDLSEPRQQVGRVARGIGDWIHHALDDAVADDKSKSFQIGLAACCEIG